VVTRAGSSSASGNASSDWALLVYRLPRVPSAPRISLWRSLRRLGAILLVDGLVALPADARTVEHLEWLAAGIHENGGEASVWTARPTVRRDGERLVKQSRAAVEAEYRALSRTASHAESDSDARRTVRALRRQLHAIESRDFFGAASAAAARRAVDRASRLTTAGTPAERVRA
jgi:hypothetical protein